MILSCGNYSDCEHSNLLSTISSLPSQRKRCFSPHDDTDGKVLIKVTIIDVSNITRRHHHKLTILLPNIRFFFFEQNDRSSSLFLLLLLSFPFLLLLLHSKTIGTVLDDFKFNSFFSHTIIDTAIPFSI